MPSSNKPNPKNSLCCNILLEIPFSPELFISHVLAHLHVTGSELEFTFFDNARIHEMNRVHLDHDWPTDIITFDLSEGDDVVTKKDDALLPALLGVAEDPLFSERDRKGEALSEKNNFLGKAEKTQPLFGDLYISVEQAALQATALGHSLEKELKILIIHGVLHLLGYDDQSPEDQTEMDEMQYQIYDLLHTPL
jgi:probable rRNA maturation factor